MQKLAPNCSKYNCDVTSTYFDSVKLRNGEICPEYPQKNTPVENNGFITQAYGTIPRTKLRKTTHRSRILLSTQSIQNKNVLNS